MGQKEKRPPHFVKEWRKYRGLNQETLADRVGIVRTSISKIERGDDPLMENRLQAFAEAFNISIPQLFEPPPDSLAGEYDMLVRRLSAARLNSAKKAQIVTVVSALLDENGQPAKSKDRAAG